MTAPEKIWAWDYRDPESGEPSTHGEWYTEDVGLDGDETEYTRSDLIPVILAEARAEGIREAAKEVINWRMSKAAGYGLRKAILALIDAPAPAPSQPSVHEAARVLLDAANNGLELFDVDGPNELEGLAIKWSGNRGDGVIQLEIAEEFMRESLRALASEDQT